MANHFSILAWRMPWTEEFCRLQSTGLQRVRHNWLTHLLTCWQKVSLPMAVGNNVFPPHRPSNVGYVPKSYCGCSSGPWQWRSTHILNSFAITTLLEKEFPITSCYTHCNNSSFPILTMKSKVASRGPFFFHLGRTETQLFQICHLPPVFLNSSMAYIFSYKERWDINVLMCQEILDDYWRR